MNDIGMFDDEQLRGMAGRTPDQLLYVLGHPVMHSKSPAMYNALYQALRLDWAYGFADAENDVQARMFLDAGAFLSVNITMPYKPLALAAAAGASVEARLAHGANVLVNTPDGYLADNTDGIGCVSYLKRRGVRFDGARVVVCGTGPTARAILHACVVAGAHRVTMLSRSVERATDALVGYRTAIDQMAAVESYRSALDAFPDERPDDRARFRASSDPASVRAAVHAAELAGSTYVDDSAVSTADVIIDATSLGMRPGDPAPFSTRLIEPRQVVFDVVYGHGTTALIAGARRRGAVAYDGAGMLVSQAVETVRDIAYVGAHELAPELEPARQLAARMRDVDLFSIMAHAAGFASLADA